MGSRAKRCATGDFGIEKTVAIMPRRGTPSIGVLAERSVIACILRGRVRSYFSGLAAVNVNRNNCLDAQMSTETDLDLIALRAA
jgi:hypothetical protein